MSAEIEIMIDYFFGLLVKNSHFETCIECSNLPLFLPLRQLGLWRNLHVEKMYFNDRIETKVDFGIYGISSSRGGLSCPFQSTTARHRGQAEVVHCSFWFT